MRTTKEVIEYLNCDIPEGFIDKEVDELVVDSRDVKEGSIFVALKGTKVNGLDYAIKAQELGASMILFSSDNEPKQSQIKGITIPLVEYNNDLNLGEFASWFYNEPSKKLKLIGITGTNGKSTITQLIAQWLTNSFKSKCAVFGTLGFGFLPKLKKSSNTTLDPIRLQSALNQVVKEGAKYAALEVSSIGVCEGRIDGCQFAAGGFTNLTRDHLDYHKTMENYALAKEQFLQMVPENKVVINIDNQTGTNYASKFENCVIYSTSKNFDTTTNSLIYSKYVWVKNVVYKKTGISLEIDSSFGTGSTTIKLLGGFNVENFACALTVLLSLGFSLDKLLETASSLQPICGRMESFSKEGAPTIVVDYAHTPDGVEQVLKGVREHHTNGRIWCVLGCGGDRDKGKRPIMAIKACVFADFAVFTSDNPRSEDPNAILKDMSEGVHDANNAIFIEDRLTAIKYAFDNAKPDDCIVIAGKGHEDYQILKDKTIHFSDREEACKLLGVTCD